jgi:hypothetical protein
MIDGYGGGPPNIFFDSRIMQRNAAMQALERDRH